MATIDSMDVRDFDPNSQMAAQERLPGDRNHAPAAEEVHAEEAAAGEQPSGAAQPENATASQAGEAASSDPVEGA